MFSSATGWPHQSAVRPEDNKEQELLKTATLLVFLFISYFIQRQSVDQEEI